MSTTIVFPRPERFVRTPEHYFRVGTVSCLKWRPTNHVSSARDANADFGFQIKEDRLPKPADAFLVIFSVVDKNSFETAEAILKNLREHEMLRSRPAILVGNKVDMARSREVSAQGTSDRTNRGKPPARTSDDRRVCSAARPGGAGVHASGSEKFPNGIPVVGINGVGGD